MKTKKLLLPMHLQLFADNLDTGTGGTDQPAGGQEQTPPGDGGKDKGNGKTFSRDEVAKMIAAEVSKTKEAWEKELQEKQEEADKLAKMNDQEKNDHEKQKLLEKIKELESAQNLAEMSKTATKMFSDKGIQATEGLLSLVVKETAEETSENVKAVVKLIETERETIKADFEKRIGSKLPLDGNADASLSRGAQMAKQANNQNKAPENNLWATN